MATQPEDDERVSRQVVYEHTTSTRQNMGAIIAAIVAALILIAFIVIQISHNPPRRKGSLTPHTPDVVAQTHSATDGLV